MKSLKIFGIAVVVGLVVVLMMERAAREKLRVENESLSQQLAQFQTDNENFSNQLGQAKSSPAFSDDKMSELMKLRGEVGVLRQQTNELEKLRVENKRLKAIPESQPAKSAPVVSQNDFPKSSWAFAGYATPENALQTWVWALDKGDKKMILASLTADQQNLFKDLTDVELSQPSPFTAYHVISTEVISDEIMNVTVDSDFPDGRTTGKQKYKFMKVGTGWKMAGQADIQ